MTGLAVMKRGRDGQIIIFLRSTEGLALISFRCDPAVVVRQRRKSQAASRLNGEESHLTERNISTRGSTRVPSY